MPRDDEVDTPRISPPVACLAFLRSMSPSGPPSHYMMHFRMVSMPAARVAQAEVSPCFLCHQTTAWNDIKGVGFIKHH